MKPSTHSPSSFECFGLVIHGLSLEQAIARIDEINQQGQPAMVVTANPEILLYARRHPDYWNVLRQADLRLVDSFGLKLAGLSKGSKPERVTGVDFSSKLVSLSAERGWKVGLIGSQPGVADKAAWELRRRYPELQIMAESGGRVNADGTCDEAGAEALFRLTQFAPDVILAAFGHPRQEAWLVRNIHALPSVKVGVGVGGTLDFWSGEKKRAPVWMQKTGFEWLFRLIREPRRWKRILDAVVVFPATVIYDRSNQHAYEAKNR